MGAPAHPVALDNVEVLETGQVAWSLLIIGDLDPYTQPVTRPASLPTGSTKSRFRVTARPGGPWRRDYKLRSQARQAHRMTAAR
ncbi:hypothetical protein CLV34_2757 [Luteimicrobium subarcticum]|uniref:Uncharacterized protein n=1 Tax=Luteimicrobium subarcticum TaxID=620910 RepID=A0A2M8W3S1_9MICO|nr:hypothetical protein CLV34_2757 [Luteimicrobium subarcticum]